MTMQRLIAGAVLGLGLSATAVLVGPAATADPSVAAPPNSLTMSCADFVALDEPTQEAVANAVIAGNRTKINANNYILAASLARMQCKFNPTYTVNRALGGPPV